jgi:hypothetical protein
VATADIDQVHHVGHVVHHMAAAVALYRRMGFVVAPPAFPVLPAGAGRPVRALGAGNAHVTFRRNFVELVTVLDGAGSGAEPGADAVLVPLEVPAEGVPRVLETIAATTERLSDALARFEGLHILVLQTPDADAVAARQTPDGVPNGGVTRVRRPGAGEAVPIGFVEIDGEQGRTPEGRLAVAEALPDTGPDHPNGALDLEGPVLCVPDAELAGYEDRYATMLGRAARADGPARVFDLDRGRVTVVPEGALDAVLPGERAPALPAFVAFVVVVRDLGATGDLLERNGLRVRSTPSGAVFVPAEAASGCAVVFRR